MRRDQRRGDRRVLINDLRRVLVGYQSQCHVSDRDIHAVRESREFLTAASTLTGKKPVLGFFCARTRAILLTNNIRWRLRLHVTQERKLSRTRVGCLRGDALSRDIHVP